MPDPAAIPSEPSQAPGELSPAEIEEMRGHANIDPWGEIVGTDMRRVLATIDALRERVERLQDDSRTIGALLGDTQSALAAERAKYEETRKAVVIALRDHDHCEPERGICYGVTWGVNKPRGFPTVPRTRDCRQGGWSSDAAGAD